MPAVDSTEPGQRPLTESTIRVSYPRARKLAYTLLIPSIKGPLTGGDHQRGRAAGCALGKRMSARNAPRSCLG